jgi:ABC-2 type transport system permease protein
MNKVWLIVQREFSNRVQKKSFLIATIVIPLIFPAIIGLLVFIAKEQEKNKQKEIIFYIDESNLFKPDSSYYIFKKFDGTVAQGKELAKTGSSFGFLHIPPIDLSNPEGITIVSKVLLSIDDIGRINGMLENQFRDLKMQQLNIDQKLLDSIKISVNVDNKSFGDDGLEKSTNTGLRAAIGVTAGILMYMFIFIYGAQIMQGIIEEKTSKVVEVIVSSVRPFQLMLGKIIGLASVGLLQFLIWIILMTTLTFGVLGALGIDPPQQQAMQQISAEAAAQQAAAGSELAKNLNEFMALPWAYIGVCFIFYFLGGYLLYGALFAAVGSSVDSPAEAQQFMFPITIPMLVSYLSLFMFILKDPHGPISVWLSIIPFTSPIAMIGRIGFNVPLWQLALSMILLVGGFLFTTWMAGRIYRVGILMHGTKVNYKVMAKWFMQKG